MKGNFLRTIAAFISSAGVFIGAAFLAILAVSSVLVTYSNGWGYRLRETLEVATVLNAPIMVAETAVCVGFCVVVLRSVVKSGVRLNEKKVLCWVCLLATLFQAWWVIAQDCNASWYSDARQLLRFGRELAVDNYDSFDRSIHGLHIRDMKTGTRYLMEYPFQSGILVYFMELFKVFGNRAPLVIQIVNIFANTGSVALLSLTAFCAFQDSETRKVIPILFGMCLPSLLYATFMYGNQLGFFFGVTALFLNAKALKVDGKRKKLGLILTSLIPMTFMMWIKSTFILFVLAIVLIWLLNALYEGKRISTICFVASVFTLIASNILGNVPTNYMETKLGYELGKGMPKTAWIAIGLENESVLGETMPGWWNGGAIASQDETNNDYDQQLKASLESIGNEAYKMATHPEYGLWFMSRKIGTEWLCPDFQSFYFAGINYKMNVPGVEEGAQFNLYDRDMWIVDEEASKRERVIDQVDSLRGFMDGYQSLIYIFSFLGSVRIFRHRRDKENEQGINFNMLLMPCVFVVGTMVYILWEAKAQYALPFFMMLPAVAAYGFVGFVKNWHKECGKI